MRTALNTAEIEHIEAVQGRPFKSIALQCSSCGTWANYKLVLTEAVAGRQVMCPFCHIPLKPVAVEPSMAEKDARRAKQWGYGQGRLTRDNKRA